ncbi:DUF721 domain-containing protein [Candidatus Halocynthiibacter alkanivorans]|jgi:hypothetical protein|uniref:DUF721 domain-containing protein n=1 Tax=Candidatus Halocynthiibacter alkanivorans TaxID=2267619 RepID=UPI000DF44BA3|nr:DciA family protein [Candidatus Halocynthiibacter alkanivorans]
MTGKLKKPWRGPDRRKRGFERTSSLLQSQIRKTSESRGFAETRLLTHWAEFVGEATAAVARPVKIGYARGGFGATLTLLTTGAQAPMLQAQLPQIKERVNACYGYAAISHIRITQTAATGFAEGQAQFSTAPKAQKPADPEIQAQAHDVAAPVGDDDLRAALEQLAQNVLTKNKENQRKP